MDHLPDPLETQRLAQSNITDDDIEDTSFTNQMAYESGNRHLSYHPTAKGRAALKRPLWPLLAISYAMGLLAWPVWMLLQQVMR